MREVLNGLFVFGGGEQPLTLAGAPGAHGMHFIPSESETNGASLQFFNDSIANFCVGNYLARTIDREAVRTGLLWPARPEATSRARPASPGPGG